MMSPERISVRIDPKLKEQLKDIVSEKGTSISNYIRTLIKVIVEANEQREKNHV